MNEDELELLVSSASPVSDHDIAELPLAGPEAELLEAIMSIPHLSDVSVGVPRPRSLRWRRRALGPVAAAVALLAGVAGFQHLDRDGGTAWAAPLVAVANAAPKILVERPAWAVTRADELTPARGEMTFGDGRHELELRWQPAGEYDATVQDRSNEAAYRESLQVVGRDAQLFRYKGTAGPSPASATQTLADAPAAPTPPADGLGPSDFTTLWIQGEHSVEVRGAFADVAAYKNVLAALREVDVDTWLGSMPASVIRPDGRAAVVDEMLSDIPLPDGFDREALRTAAGVKDRYQLGSAVAGSAACAWIDRWITATDTGDPAAANRAVEAMGTSHRWSVLVDMKSQGAYPDAVWELADAMATNAPVSGGKPMTIRESYADTLGCATR